MADSLVTELKTTLAWLFQEAGPLSTISDAAKLEYALTLPDGTLNGQADKIWHDQRTLAASAHEDLDLTALALSAFGGTLSVALAKVKAIAIVNAATTAGEDLRVGGAGAGANAWGAPWAGNQDAKNVAPADSVLLLVNKLSGWATSGSSKILRVANVGAGSITYKIAIVGTSV